MNLKVKRILYVSHRYHTNQIPIMKGWYDNNVKVKFLATYQGTVENHDYVEFHQLKPSFISKICNYYIDKHFQPSEAENLKIKYFIPSIFDVLKQLYLFNPEIVILRDFTIFNLLISFLCRCLMIRKLITYVQTPLYGFNKKRNILKKILRLLFPSACFTPILFKGSFHNPLIPSSSEFAPKWFVPLICNTQPDIKPRMKNDILHIIDIGKYRDYKNHFFLVDAIKKVANISRLKVKIIGQLSQSSERDYYDKLKLYVEQCHLENTIEVLPNVPFEEMDKLYKQADVLILASKSESAGMVIFEGMSYGLCVLSSINCGLACFLDEYKCGCTFSLDNTNMLANQLNELSDNPTMIYELGKKSIETIKDHFSFLDYCNKLNDLTTSEFHYNMYDNS